MKRLTLFFLIGTAGGLTAQTTAREEVPAATPPPTASGAAGSAVTITTSAPTTVKSPFHEDEDIVAQERAKEEARQKAEAAKAVAIINAKTARVAAVQMALAPIKVLARGWQGQQSVVLLATSPGRPVMLALNESLTLGTPQGPAELTLTKVTRQTLTFVLPDGTLFTLQ